MTIEEVIEKFNGLLQGIIQDDMQDALNIAITALRQMRTEPCEDTYSQCEECGQAYLDNRGYDYCPNCGRKLVSE